MRRLLAWAGAVAWLAAVAPAAPALGAPTLVRTLDNGLKVAVFTDHRLPIVQIQVLVPAGTRQEQALESGAAQAAAMLLTRGTTSRASADFAREVENLGATMVGSAARDYATLSGAFRAADFERGLELVADATINPIFEEQEFNAARQELMRRVMESRRRLDVVADEHAWALVMRGHPYAAPENGSLEGFAALTRERLIGFHRVQYRPDRALLAIAGDVEPERAWAAVQQAFGVWAGRARSDADARFPSPDSVHIRLVDVPGGGEAEIRLAMPVPARGSSDADAMAVANDLLGAGRGSRLSEGSGRVLRTYSNLQMQREAGLLMLGTSAANDSVVTSLARLRAALDGFAADPPGAAEVERSRRVLARSFPLYNETLGARAAQWLTSAYLGMSDDQPDRYPARMEGVTAEAVAALARRDLRSSRAQVVVVGAAATLRPALEALGTVEVVPVGAAAAPVTPAPSMRVDPPDAAALARGRQLIQQAVTAHGGLARLKAVKDSRSEGEITLFSDSESVVGRQVELRREPDRMRVETTFLQVATVQTLDGDTAWVRVAGGARDSTFMEGPDAVAGMNHVFHSDVLHLLLTASDSKSRVAYRGQEDLAAGMADVIELVNAAGARWVLFLDPRKHQVIAVEENEGSVLRGPALRRLFGEFRTVQGVAWPHLEERFVGGTHTLRLKINSVVVNSGIASSVFKMPVVAPAGHPRR